MPRSYPTLTRYLSALPDGLASHPEMHAKGSLVRSILTDTPPHRLAVADGLPPRLDDILRSPPSATDWLPETELWALTLAVYDTAFAQNGAEAAYERWVHARNLRLLRSPLYRVLFAVASPERLFTSGAKRVAAFHRGAVIDGVAVSKGKGSFTMKTPPGLLPDLARVGLGAAVRAGLEVAGALDAVVTASAIWPGVLRFDAEWR